jgi:hypothetical protein
MMKVDALAQALPVMILSGNSAMRAIRSDWMAWRPRRQAIISRTSGMTLSP